MYKFRLLGLTVLLLAWTSQGSAQFAHTEHKQIVDGGGPSGLRASKPLLVRATNLGNWIVPEDQLQPATRAEAGASVGTQIPANKIQLPKGTAVRLFLMEPVSTGSAKAGDSVKLQVLGPVKVDNLVVIANKAPAWATITEVHKGGVRDADIWPLGGLKLRLDSVMLVDQQKQPLQAEDAPKKAATNAAVEWAQPILQTGGGTLLLLSLNEMMLPRGAEVTAVMSGDTLLDRSAVEAAQPAPAVRKHGDASVTVYYPHIWLGPSLTLWCGSVPIGKARKGQKLNFALPPGEYHFRLWQTGDQYLLHAEDGEEYYMQIVVPSFRANKKGPPKLLLMEHDVGELDSGYTTWVEAKDTPDMTKYELAQLQAEPPAKKHR